MTRRSAPFAQWLERSCARRVCGAAGAVRMTPHGPGSVGIWIPHAPESCGDALERARLTSPSPVSPARRTGGFGATRGIRGLGAIASCDHKHPTKHQRQGATSARKGRSNVEAQRNETFRDVCAKCGAKRTGTMIGLEPTFDAHLERLVGRSSAKCGGCCRSGRYAVAELRRRVHEREPGDTDGQRRREGSSHHVRHAAPEDAGRPQGEGPDDDAGACRSGSPGRRLVAAVQGHLAQAEPDAGAAPTGRRPAMKSCS